MGSYVRTSECHFQATGWNGSGCSFPANKPQCMEQEDLAPFPWCHNRRILNCHWPTRLQVKINDDGSHRRNGFLLGSRQRSQFCASSSRSSSRQRNYLWSHGGVRQSWWNCLCYHLQVSRERLWEDILGYWSHDYWFPYFVVLDSAYSQGTDWRSLKVVSFYIWEVLIPRLIEGKHE